MSVHISSWAWKQAVGDAGAKLVLLKLADQANDRGECWPSQRTLAAECEMSRRTVIRKLELLDELGLIGSERRMRSTGGKTSNLYTVGPMRQVGTSRCDTGDAPDVTPVSQHEPSLEPSTSDALTSTGPSGEERHEEIREKITTSLRVVA